MKQFDTSFISILVLIAISIFMIIPIIILPTNLTGIPLVIGMTSMTFAGILLILRESRS